MTMLNSQEPGDGAKDRSFPSWSIVRRYLRHGERREEIESLAAISPPFAMLLAALRRDHEERAQRAERRSAQRARRERRKVMSTGKIPRTVIPPPPSAADGDEAAESMRQRTPSTLRVRYR